MNHRYRAGIVFNNDFFTGTQATKQRGKPMRPFQFRDVNHMLGHNVLLNDNTLAFSDSKKIRATRQIQIAFEASNRQLFSFGTALPAHMRQLSLHPNAFILVAEGFSIFRRCEVMHS